MEIKSITKTFEIPMKKEEVVQILRITTLALDRAIRNKKISYLKVGHTFTFTAEQVNAYIEQNTFHSKYEKNKTNGGENN